MTEMGRVLTPEKGPSSSGLVGIWTCPRCREEFVVTLDQARTHVRLCDGPNAEKGSSSVIAPARTPS